MAPNDRIRVIFNHSKIQPPSGETVLVTVVTFEEPACCDVNFVIGMRDKVHTANMNKGAIYVFPLEPDHKIRFGIVYEGHIGDEIAKALSSGDEEVASTTTAELTELEDPGDVPDPSNLFESNEVCATSS